ncbi:hypothetical protein ACIQZB_41260 [Streptomyces sp. NPDC097727]
MVTSLWWRPAAQPRTAARTGFAPQAAQAEPTDSDAAEATLSHDTAPE